MTKKPAKKRPAKRAVIPAGTRSIDAVYDILVRDLGLPAHFGRNLDALYDALTGDVSGPFIVVIEDAPGLRKALGAKGTAVIRTFREVAGARRDATFMYGLAGRR